MGEENKQIYFVCGGGHQGLAMAAHLALNGEKVTLWNRTPEHIDEIMRTGRIYCSGEVNGIAKIEKASDNIEEVVTSYILVTVPSTAYHDVAQVLAPYVNRNTVIVLNPGRTFGAIEFSEELKKNGVKHIYARAIDNLHQSILEAFNLERILTPEKRAANDLTLELSLNTQCSTFNITKDFMVLKFTAPEKFVGHSYRSINFSRFGLVLISAVRKVTENNLLGLSSSREEILDLERKSMEEKIASRDEIIVMGTRKNITDFLSSVQTN